MEYLRASGTDWGSTSFDDAATEVQIVSNQQRAFVTSHKQVVVGSEETNKAKFLAHYLGFDVIAEDPTGLQYLQNISHTVQEITSQKLFKFKMRVI
jgi:hypothetical protein